MNRLITLITTLCLLYCIAMPAAHGQDAAYDIFQSEEALELDLSFDLRLLLKKKYKAEYIPAQLNASLEDGRVISENIKVRARGKSRLSYCHMPPLKLNFKEDGSSKFLGQKTLKLVIPCKSGKTFQQYVYSEYLAYKMFNLISEVSFRVRLVNIKITDSQGKRKDFQAYGFLIEHIDEVAERNASRELEITKFSQRFVQKETMAKVAVFQYAIGNTDWAVDNGHNLKFLQLNDLGSQIVHIVPYDFDYAGMVNAMYAIPHDKLGLETVLDRLFMGSCLHESIYERIFQTFREQESAMFQLIENEPYLEEKTRYHIKRYLSEFYQILDNPRLIQNNILGYCK